MGSGRRKYTSLRPWQPECLSYLPKMNLFPWLAFLPEDFENGVIQKVFGPATIWRGAAFHFLAVSSKMKILWKL